MSLSCHRLLEGLGKKQCQACGKAFSLGHGFANIQIRILDKEGISRDFVNPIDVTPSHHLGPILCLRQWLSASEALQTSFQSVTTQME